MKEFAKDYSTTIPPIAIDDLRDDYKDAIQCIIISLEKVVQKLEKRIVDITLELANAKADRDSMKLKESMRRRTTSDASPMFASWRGVDEVENTFARAGSTETECSGSTTPSTPTPSPPTPKKILRRATLSIGGGGSTNPMKFGRRNSMPNAFKADNKEKMKLKRVSWPGVDEDHEDEDENDQCPLPTTQQLQSQPFKLFRRASAAPVIQVQEPPPNRQIGRSLSGRRIVVDQQDDASDITFLQQPPPPPSRSINREDESSQRSFDIGQLFKRDNSRRRRSSTEGEEPVVEEEGQESSPNRLLGLGQLFQGRNKNRLYRLTKRKMNKM